MEAQKSAEHKYIIQMPDVDYDPDPRGLGYVFHDCMLKHKDKLAQIYGPTGEKDTFGQLHQRSIRTAVAMKKYGVKPGDYVSLCTFNHLDSSTPIIASYFIGAIMAAVDPTLSLEDTIHLLKLAPPKLIFVLPEAVEMIEKAVKALSTDTKIVVYGSTTNHIPFSDFLQPCDEEDSFKPIEVKSINDTAIIFFSSGTSGLPKGICVNHYSMFSFYQITLNCGYDAGLTLAYSSPYWSILANCLGMSIMSGTTRLVFPRYDPANAWKIFDYKLTTIYLNTVQILTMLSQGRPENVNISSMKDIFVGGGTVKLEQMLQIKKMFHETRVTLNYGLTEIPGSILTFKPGFPRDMELFQKNPSSTGTPVPGVSYKIVNPETEEILGPNQEGELRIKTKFQLSGYHNRDSSEIWDSDGWFKTGDVAYYDEDHCFYVVDRIKEMFKFQSWHVSPAVLEGVILTHPAVSLAIVIGVPHPIDGDHPMAVVTLKSSHKDVTAQEIEKYVEGRVQDRQRLRAGVKILDKLPMTASGKIDRKTIKELARKGKL